MQIVVRGTVTSKSDPLAGGSGSIVKRTTTANLPATIERWHTLGRTNITITVVPVSGAHIPPKRQPSSANVGDIARQQNIAAHVLANYPNFN